MYVYVVTYIEGGWDNVSAVYTSNAEAARYALGGEGDYLTDEECEAEYEARESRGETDHIIHEKFLKGEVK